MRCTNSLTHPLLVWCVVIETRSLRDNDIPLLERISLGPVEDDAKIFIIDRQQTLDITEEVGENFLMKLQRIYFVIWNLPTWNLLLSKKCCFKKSSFCERQHVKSGSIVLPSCMLSMNKRFSIVTCWMLYRWHSTSTFLRLSFVASWTSATMMKNAKLAGFGKSEWHTRHPLKSANIRVYLDVILWRVLLCARVSDSFKINVSWVFWAVIYTVRQKKGTNFFLCASFIILDRNWWIFTYTLRKV